MAARRPLVRRGGRVHQLASTDTISGLREQVTGSRTYYVRADGNDSNTGLVDSAGGAFLTVQKAIDTVAALDISIYSVGISVGAGTFASFVCKDPVGAGGVTISGAGATTIISRSETTGSAVSAQGACTRYTISSAKIQAPNGTACNGVLATVGQLISVSNVTMGACSAFHFNAAGGQININGAVTIDGNAQIHWLASYRGQIIASANVTLSGSRAFSQGFALANTQALILTGAITFTGSATGKRYTVASQAQINVNGAGASYLPGNAAGTVDAATFGVYA